MSSPHAASHRADQAGRHDVVIVGGGHNGLVCAAYLAAGGLDVAVCERRSVLGGAAVTETFHPGFRNSIASYTVSLLNPQVIADLRLREHGLSIVHRPLGNFLPLADGRHFKLGGGLANTQREIAKFSARDAERLPAYYAMLERVVALLRELNVATPPRLGPGAGLHDWLGSLVLSRRLRGVGQGVRRDLLDLFTRSAGDLLDQWFESDPIKAALGWDSVVGNFASPYTPGSAYVLLHHLFGEIDGESGAWGHAIGGMGAISEAIAAECRARGVTLICDAPVERVLVDGKRGVTGVLLADGRTLEASRVAANVGPKLLFDRLIDASSAPDTSEYRDFRQRIDGMRIGSASFRMNLALSTLPDFRCLPGTQPAPHHGAGILFAESLGYMERAYFDAKQPAANAGWSRSPIVELNLSSTLDATLAPEGQHVASVFCQHFDPALRERWDQHRDAAVASVLDVIEAQVPRFRDTIVGLQALTPFDLERTFGLVAGDIFHGALQLNQLWAARPVLGHGDYRMPIDGLYLCGSGAHPGGGVTGVPGMNAAREILRDVARKKFGRNRR
ncbi:NAD(P)/FAD-dependent oxidoreductase [soil metagenome]